MPFFPQTSDTNFNHSSVTDVGGSQTNTTGGIHIQIPNYSISKCGNFLPVFLGILFKMHQFHPTYVLVTSFHLP